MPALWKFLVLLALFLLASKANAFTNLSSLAGNQVQVNHLILFQQPISNPMNESTRKLIHELTKRLEQDALLPGNLSSKGVMFSDQKQEAELPSNNTDSTTQFTSSYTFEAVNNVIHAQDKHIVTNQVTFSDERDNEIHSKIPVETNSRPHKWQMPDKINLDSSGL